MIEVLRSGSMKNSLVLIALFTFSIVSTFMVSLIFSCYNMCCARRSMNISEISEDEDSPASAPYARDTKKMAINQPENLKEVFYPVERASEPEQPRSEVYSESYNDEAIDEESKWLDLGPR